MRKLLSHSGDIKIFVQGEGCTSTLSCPSTFSPPPTRPNPLPVPPPLFSLMGEVLSEGRQLMNIPGGNFMCGNFSRGEFNWWEFFRGEFS